MPHTAKLAKLAWLTWSPHAVGVAVSFVGHGLWPMASGQSYFLRGSSER